jgi:hypothetical protein
MRMAIVGDPGNPSVGVVQTFGGPKGKFVDPPKNTGIYKNCSDAPAAPPPCLTVGGVSYTYGIGDFETTVSQYVTFLNTVDPHGTNRRQLYFDNMSPTVWPQYGSVRYTSGAGVGQHYSVAYPEWAQKPFNFGDFSRAARFINSLDNGTVLSHTQSSSGRLQVRRVQGAALSANRAGHVRHEQSGDEFPPGLDLQKNYMANVSTVGQTKTTSPWGTYDQGGNVVEILDTLAPQPPGYNFLRNWHYYHGGVANAPAYQLGISAFGYFPGDTTFSRAYPVAWLPRGHHRKPPGDHAAIIGSATL